LDKSIIIIGPAYPLRGGLATFLFPGTTQYSSEAAPEGLKILSKINSINPLSWIYVGNELKNLKPDIIVVRYWLPFMGPALGKILRTVRKNNHTKIIAITDNILPHEKRPGDIAFTKYFLKSPDAFITMSEKVMNDLRQFEKTKPAKQVLHPLYDNFGEIISKKEARDYLHLNHEEKIILFFGFIRKYKGLDILLEAMADERIRSSKIKLMIAGEFYEDEKPYKELIEKLNIKDSVILRTNFIPDSEVKYYLCAADVVAQPYRNATQSGVTPLAYHFEKPMIVSNVGGLPTLVPNEKVGLVAKPEPASIADAILRYYELGADYFIPHLRMEKQKYSWQNLVKTITDLANDIQK
jgi:glycosyltransferase involved in cell wall biosynthesis